MLGIADKNADSCEVSDNLEENYNRIPYEDYAIEESHPEYLAALAMLHNLEVADAASCSVLELGCASGANIIPMAATLPNSEFVGVDLARRQIDMGRSRVSQLQLQNIALHHLNISNIGKDFGLFDFIIVHGVFSWVSKEVQDQILRILAQNLKPQGLAYLSYNVYPGWHTKEILRDTLLFHTRGYPWGKEQVRESRALLNTLEEHYALDAGPHNKQLVTEIQHLKKADDQYLLHEYLAPENRPIYFSELCQRAEGLQYVCDTSVGSMMPATQPRVMQALHPEISNVEKEQYFDFFTHRAFRQSLFVHQGRAFDRNLDLTRLAKLHYELKPQHQGAQGAVDHILQAARPGWLSFDDIAGAAPHLSPSEIALHLSRLILSDHVKLHSLSPLFCSSVGSLPRVPAFTRLAVATGKRPVSLKHQLIQLSDFLKRLIPKLDGTQTAEQCAVALGSEIRQVERGLSQLAEAGLLEPENPLPSIQPKVQGIL